MRAAGRALGTSARILAETVRTALLPLAAVNLGVRKFEDYLRGRFADELDAATAHIPEESLQEPPLNVAGPVMQGLGFSYESEELRAMFLALLATSMNSSKTEAHPAFADIVRQLDPDEALILEAALRDEPRGVAVASFHRRVDPEGNIVALANNVLPLLDWEEPAGTGPDLQRFAAYVDNWVRLGLVEVDYARAFSIPGRYDWLERWPLPVHLRRAVGADLVTERGRLTVTDWGRRFATAVNVSGRDKGRYSFELPPLTAPRPEPVARQVVDGGSP